MSAEYKVVQDFHRIKTAENVSEQEQLSAVSENGFLIKYCKHPTETVKITAVMTTPKCLGVILNPSDAAILAAIQADPSMLEMVGLPSDIPESISPPSYKWIIPSQAAYPFILKMKVVAFFEDSTVTVDNVVEFINSSEEQVQLSLVSKIPSAIQLITDPSEEVQMAAVVKSYSTIRFIEESCEAVQLEAVKHNKYLIDLIKNPTKLVRFLTMPESEQIELVTNDPDAIKTMADPSEKVQLAAIAQDPRLLLWIRNPSPKALIAAVSADFSLYYAKNVFGEDPYWGNNHYSKYPHDYNHIFFAAWKKDHENPQRSIAYDSHDYVSNELSYFMAKYDVDVYLKSLNIETNNLFNFLNSSTIDFQLQIVEAVPAAMYFIDNPTEELQLKCVTKANEAIHLIKNPTEKVQLHAINNDFRYDEYCVIRCIKNPTQAVLDRLSAIKEERRILQIEKIKTYNAHDAALVLDIRPDLIEHISEEVKNQLLNHNGMLIKYIENPTEEQQIQAITQNKAAFTLIKNPSETVKILAFFS